MVCCPYRCERDTSPTETVSQQQRANVTQHKSVAVGPSSAEAGGGGGAENTQVVRATPGSPLEQSLVA